MESTQPLVGDALLKRAGELVIVRLIKLPAPAATPATAAAC